MAGLKPFSFCYVIFNTAVTSIWLLLCAYNCQYVLSRRALDLDQSQLSSKRANQWQVVDLVGLVKEWLWNLSPQMMQLRL